MARKATKQARIELARRSIKHFTNFTFPGYNTNWHHAVVFDALDRWVAGEIENLMIFEPPRHGKSEAVSRRLPAYIMGRFPDAQVMAASYSADLASRMNRDVQRIIDSPAYRAIFPDTRLFGKNIRSVAGSTYLRNSDIFEVVDHKGSYRGAGVGGGITGMGFHFGILDDPIKNRKEANSPTFRISTWEWFTSTFYTRQERNARMLVTETPWHPDDVAMRLLALADDDPAAMQWTVYRFPAIADETIDASYDPRQAGEALWPAKYDADKLAQIRATVGEFEWNALYQCRPRIPEGNVVKREWFDIVDAVPRDCQWVRYWDKAGTADGGAFTAGVLMGKHRATGAFFIGDVVRGQWSAGERERTIHQTAQLDETRHGRIQTLIEQEPGSGGKESAENTIRRLAGFNVKADRPTGDKETRFYPFAAQAEIGEVKLVKGKWNGDWLFEVCAFPDSIYKDQADATAGAFNALMTRQGGGNL